MPLTVANQSRRLHVRTLRVAKVTDKWVDNRILIGCFYFTPLAYLALKRNLSHLMKSYREPDPLPRPCEGLSAPEQAGKQNATSN